MSKCRQRRLLIMLAIFCTCVFASNEKSVADAYCGIYSIYGAANSLGVESEFQQLIDKRYVSSRKGSSAADLIKAGNKLGVNVTAFWHLGEATLESSMDPLVLHFCSYGQLNSYDHWVLFLGMKDGKAVISDSNSGPSMMSISDVLLRWDGVALAVHVADKPLTDFSKVETGSLFPWFVFFASVCFLSKCLNAKLGFGKVMVVFLIFILASIFWSNETYLRRPSSLLYAISSYQPGRFGTISRKELQDLLIKGESDAEPASFLVIDARFPTGFETGSIPGSVNIPANANIKEIRLVLGEMDKKTELIIFCLSEKCGFDRQVGVKVAGEGFANIRIYEEGWLDWLDGKK